MPVETLCAVEMLRDYVSIVPEISLKYSTDAAVPPRSKQQSFVFHQMQRK